jgi:hypothetical protein
MHDFTTTPHVINSLGVCRIDPQHPQFEFFVELYKRHHSYNAQPISYFVIAHEYGSPHLNVVNDKGESNRFGWRSAMDAKPKSSNVKQHLTDAMRFAISDQITNFRLTTDQRCCQICKSTDNLEVDHNKTQFCKIRNGFLAQTTIKPPVTFCKNENRFRCFNDADADFKNAWVAYHNNKADYQMLCKQCNGKKR